MHNEQLDIVYRTKQKLTNGDQWYNFINNDFSNLSDAYAKNRPEQSETELYEIERIDFTASATRLKPCPHWRLYSAHLSISATGRQCGQGLTPTKLPDVTKSREWPA